jgi:opacity protein-like surface antigen
MVWGAFMSKKSHCRLASLTLLDIAAGIAVSAAALPALAADMPTKAPAPIAAPVYNWTGFYLGAHAGYRWADADLTSAGYIFDPPGGFSGPVTFPARNESYDPNGGIVGVHGGYNYQFAPNWLFGVEGDWTWGKASDSKSSALTVVAVDGFVFRSLSTTSEVKLGWQATIRGRLGYTQGPWLIYGTGGVAFARAEWSETATLTTIPAIVTIATAASSAHKTLTGFAVGGGAEYMFTQNWIGRIEYLYESFGDFNVPSGFGTQTANIDLSAQKVRVGISYKFGN